MAVETPPTATLKTLQTSQRTTRCGNTTRRARYPYPRLTLLNKVRRANLGRQIVRFAQNLAKFWLSFSRNSKNLTKVAAPWFRL